MLSSAEERALASFLVFGGPPELLGSTSIRRRKPLEIVLGIGRLMFFKLVDSK